MTEIRGSVEVTWTVRHRVALSRLTDGWTDEERRALRDGDDGARAELIYAVWADGKDGGFNEVDEDFVELTISEPEDGAA